MATTSASGIRNSALKERVPYQIAKNCRTSVEMIEKFYASHIKTRLDAAAINIMRKKKVARAVAKELRTGT
jgi:hypothetical protein